MADIQANIGISLETAEAMARLKGLQREISAFHTAMAKGSASAAASAATLQQKLLNNINKTGQFSAQMTTIKTTTESFTNALEKNKLSMGEYFRYAGASTKTFGRFFRSEFATINKVARERVKDLQTQYIKMGRDANGAMRAIAVRPLALDMDNLATKTMIAAQRQQLFNQLLRQGSTNLLNFGKNTQWAGRQLMVGFTIPLTIFGATAAREFMKLEEQAIKFKRVYGDMFTTSSQTEKALDNVRKLADEFTKYGIAAEKTIELAAKVAQMGNMGDAMEAQVKQATRLAVLGGLEQQEALDTTISLTNAFGVATEDLADNINFLNAAENQTILSIEDFNEAIPKAGSVVKQLGGDVGDLAFFLTAMREGGVNASQGANALKSSLARLINPTEVAQEKLGEMGINVLGIVEANAGNLRGTIMALATELDRLDPLTRARAIEQLFGKFQFARMSTLFSNITKEGSQASKVLELTGKSTEELGILAERELGRVEDSVTYKFQKSLEQFQVALAPLGEAFLKAVTPLIEFGTKILDKFNSMGDGAKQFVVIVSTVLGAIGPVALMTFGLMANGAANLIKMFANLGMFYQRLTGQSRTLGVTTDYMTREQLQASAVAASLEQSHARLIQVYTTEASSLARLSAAYNKAAASQRQFVVSGGGAAVPRKKYAKGVVSVPGPRGAGDIIPAMLSPGEAVIPADAARIYSPLIQAMISGTIPGFAEGTDSVGYKRSTPEKIKMTDFTASDETRGSKGKLSKAERAMALKAAGLPAGSRVPAGAGVVPQFATQFGQMPAQLVEERLRAEEKAIRDYNKNLPKNQRLSSKEIARLVTRQREHLIGSVKVGDRTFKSWERGAWRPGLTIGNQLTDELRKQSGFRSAYGEALKQANPKIDPKTFNRIMSNAQSGVGLAQGDLKYHQRALSAFAANPANQARFPDMTKMAGLTSAGLQASLATASAQGNSRAAQLANVPESERRAAASNLKKIAPIVAERRPRRERGSAAVREEQIKRQAEKNDKAASRTRDKTAKSRVRNAKIEEDAQKKTAKVVRQSAAEKQFRPTATTLRMFTPKQIDSLLADGKNPNRVAATMAQRQITAKTREVLGKEGVAKALAEGKDPNRVAAGVRSGQARQASANAETPAAKSSRGISPGAMGAIGMAGVIGASFAPGKIGELAQQAILPMMLLPMLKPLIATPMAAGITAVVAALGAVVIGILSFNKAMKEAREAGRELAGSMSWSSDRIQQISEFTGKVSASELAQRQRDQLIAGPTMVNDPKFGQSFLESDAGAAFMEDVNRMQDAGMTADQISRAIGRNLTQAMLQGVLTKDQAHSIVMALGQQLSDYSIPLEINAQINSLVGPTGAALERDPFDVAVNVQTDAIEEQAEIFQQLMESQERIGDLAADQKFAEVAPIAMGVGTVAGGIIGGLPTVGLGAAPGAGIGLGAGYGYALAESEKARSAAEKEVASAAVNLGFEALNLGQQQLDVIEQTRRQKIEQLQTELQIADTQERQAQILNAISQTEADAAEARAGVLNNNTEMLSQLQQQALLLGGKEFSELSSGAVQARYEGTGLEGLAEDTSKRLADVGTGPNFFEALGSSLTKSWFVLTGQKTQEQINEEDRQAYEKRQAETDFRISLESGYGAGLFDFSTINTLLDAAENNEDIPISFNMLVDKQGLANANIVTALLEKLNIEANEYPIVFDFMSNNQEDFDENMQALSYLAQVPSDYGFEIDFTGESAAENIDAVGNAIQDLEGMPDTIDKQMLIDAGNGNATAALFLQYWDQITGGADTVNKSMVITFRTLMAGDQNLISAYASAMGMSAEAAQRFSERADAEEIAAAYLMEQQFTPFTPEIPEVEPLDTDSGGGGTPSSVLDDMLKKLRDVQDATIGVAKGWDAARASLDRLFAGGETITKFAGLEQLMRGMNIGENLIETIVGMDPEEFEKRKRELFTFDSSGNITGITTALRNMNLAMNSIALGDYQSEQKKTVRVYKDQLIALNKLIGAGMNYSAAYEAVSDAAVATAIAQEKSRSVIKKLVKDANEAARALKDFAAAQAVAGGLEETASQRDIANWLAKNKNKLTNAQVEAILKDTNLQRLILNPSIDPRAVNEALDNAAKQADLDLALNKLTIEGMTEIFDDGFSKAMERFSAREQQIELDFNVRTRDDENIIINAQREIDTLRYTIDDLEADLTRIGEVEDDINTKYDDRIEALDEVSAIAERINKTQKAQLSVADALSQGDIAAAARAAQEYRQQQAESALDERKTRLESQRQEELDNIRLDNGKSRAELEEQIRDLQKEIFNIEEERLEPAQRRMQLAEDEKTDLIDSLEVLGRTREQWQRIQNNIDVAKTSSDSYTRAIQNSLDVVGDILMYWNELDGKQVTTYHQIVEQRTSSPSPSQPSTGGGNGGNTTSAPSGPTWQEKRDANIAKIQRELDSLNSQISDLVKRRNSARTLSQTYAIPKAERDRQAAIANQLTSQISVASLSRQYTGKALSEFRANANNPSYWSRFATGGLVNYKRLGGLLPYKALGGIMAMSGGGMFKSINTDSIPAMLSAGEYVVKRSAVQNFGVDNLEKINSGTYSGESVYNYNLAVNVKSDADPDKIARTVIRQIKQVDSQRIRGNRL